MKKENKAKKEHVNIGYEIALYKDILQNANMKDIDKRTLIEEFIETLEKLRNK